MTQTQIPGTEREVDPELNAVIEELRIAESNHRATKQALDKVKERADSMLVGLNPARRQAFERAYAVGPAVYHYTDDKGDEVEATVELVRKVKVRKTGAADTPIGEGVDAGDDQEDDEDDEKPRRGGVHPGLLAAAERDGDVVENDEGDVVPSDKPAKRTKARRARKARRK